MSLFDLLLSVGAAAGLAYVGKKQNEEAALRNENAIKIQKICNEYVNSVNIALDQRRDAISDFFKWYGEFKKASIKDVIGYYCQLMNENFVNFKAVLKPTTEKYNSLKIEQMDKIQENVKKLSYDQYFTTYTTSYSNNTGQIFAVALGSLGIGTTIAAIAGNSLTTLFPFLSGFSLINLIPISFGIGCSVVGYFNNYKSKKNLEQVASQYKQLVDLEPKVQETINYLNQLIENFQTLANSSQDIIKLYASELINLSEATQDENSPFFSSKEHPIDASKLPLEAKKRLRYIYALSRLVYSTLDVALFEKDGKYRDDSATELTNHFSLINKEIESFYGK